MAMLSNRSHNMGTWEAAERLIAEDEAGGQLEDGQGAAAGEGAIADASH